MSAKQNLIITRVSGFIAAPRNEDLQKYRWAWVGPVCCVRGEHHTGAFTL